MQSYVLFVYHAICYSRLAVQTMQRVSKVRLEQQIAESVRIIIVRQTVLACLLGTSVDECQQQNEQCEY